MRQTQRSIQLNKVIAKLGMLAILALLLSSVAVQAATDGITGSSEGSVFLKGQVTKDVTNINSLFDGITGSNTYTLTDNSTNLTNMRLLNGEYTNTNGIDQYGNITFDPSQIIHSKYNSSKLLDKGDWVESDPNSEGTMTYDTVGSKLNYPDTLRLHYVYSTTESSVPKWTNTLTASVSPDNYIRFGVKINSDTNTTAALNSFYLKLNDGTNSIMIRFREDVADWISTSESGLEIISFDDDAGDVIYLQAKISDLDSLQSTFTFGSVSSLEMAFAGRGTASIDIFDLSFDTVIAKAGYDRADQVSSADDYVALNVTNPSSPDSQIREIDPKITYIADATIDFVADVSSVDTYDADNYRVTKDYTFKLGTPSTWQDDVTFANLAVYHVLESSYTDYTSYTFESTDLSTSILNEEAGDVIVASSSISEDVEYTLKYQVQYTQAAYDALIASESMSWTDWMQYAFWAVFAFLVPVTFFKDKKADSNRRGKTRAANKR